MKNFIQWADLDLKGKSSGTIKIKCPACIDGRKNKQDRSFMVNITGGFGKCFHCEALTFRDDVHKETEVTYTIPAQTWKNYTNLSDAMVKYCEHERKINQFTLKHFNITEEKFYQPAHGKEVNNIVFNYFENDVVVNKKYRSGAKKFTQSKNGKPIFYNINAVIGADECYIVEGEFDVLAFYEVGIKNVISIPNGANDNDNYWKNSEKYLKDIKKFFIAVDNDEKGEIVAEKIAQRLGRFKCEKIIFEGKDANDDLISGNLAKSALNRYKYPVSGTFKVEDVYDKILELYDNGLPKTIYPKDKSFGKLKEIFSVMFGHLVTVTGVPSHGKSNYTEWYVLNLIRDYELKASFFSPEHHPLELHHSTFIQKVYGKNYFKDFEYTPRVTKTEIERYKDWANEKIYLTCPDNGEFATWDWLFDKFKEQMFNYGINIFVIDAFNKVEFNGKGNKLDQIGSVLSRLTSFAQIHNVIIFLVAHPTKMKKNESGAYEMPNLYDVSGSADFRNQTHDGFCIYRHFGEENHTVFANLKTKFSFQGEIGATVEYEYHIPSGRYYEKGSDVPTYCLIDEENTFEDELFEENPKQITASLQDAFGNNFDESGECPF